LGIGGWVVGIELTGFGCFEENGRAFHPNEQERSSGIPVCAMPHPFAKCAKGWATRGC